VVVDDEVVVVDGSVDVADGGCDGIVSGDVADGRGGSGVLRCVEGFRDTSGGSVEVLALLYAGRGSSFSAVCTEASTVGLGLI
jgi:hypothetical protein